MEFESNVGDLASIIKIEKRVSLAMSEVGICFKLFS